MNNNEISKRLNLSEIILPIILCKNKKSNLNVLKIFNEIENKTNLILESIEDDHKITPKNRDEIEYDIKFGLTNYIIYEIIHNDSYYLDDYCDYIIEIYTSIKDKNVNPKSIITNKNEYLLVLISKIQKEINKFHSILFFSGVIDFNKLKELNENIIKEIVININSLIEYLKKDKKNGNTFIYDIIKIAVSIYEDIFEGLFFNLSKDEIKMKKYVTSQDKYMKTVNMIFIEQYSLLNTACEKINKKINFEK
jgi:hypothetical protein